MAKYEIKHSCGHVEEHQIYGTNVHGEREREAARLASKPCKECVKKEAAERASRNGEDGATVLKGSVGQIAWALDVRERMVEEIRAFEAGQVEKGLAAGKSEDEVEAFRGSIENAISNIGSVEDAEWFIDHRNLDGVYLVREALRIK